MLGGASSGEAEPVLLRHGGRWWLTVGSDHTDREVESLRGRRQQAAVRQAAGAPGLGLGRASPTAPTRWCCARRSSRTAPGSPTRKGCWRRSARWQSLLAGLPADVPVADGLLMFCGTLGALPRGDGVGIRPAARTRIEIVDGATGRRLHHEYQVTPLPRVA